MKLNLKPEERRKLIEEIQYFFESERDETIGVIAAEQVLDFFVENLGTKIYNQSLDDAKFFFTRRMEDMDSDFGALYK